MLIKSFSSLLFNKLIAIYLGPTGITLQAHVMNVFNALIAIPQEGTNRSLIKYLSPKNQLNTTSSQYIFGGIIINLTAFLLLGLYLFINHDTFFRIFSYGESQLVWGGVFLLSVCSYIFHTFFLSFLQIQQDFKRFAVLNTLGNLFGLAMLAYFITQHAKWALLGLPLGLAIAIIPTIIFAYPTIKKFLAPVKWQLQESTEQLQQMSGFVLMAMSILLFEYITSFAMREYSIGIFSVERTGFWQSVSTLSGYYIAAFSAIVMTVYYPQVAAKIDTPRELSQYIKSMIALLVPIIIIGLSIVFFFRAWFIETLFSSEFDIATVLFRFQLGGDFFKLVSLLLGSILLAQGRVVPFIILQAISALIYIITVPLCADYFDLEAFPFAHFLRHSSYFLLLLIVCRKVLFHKK